jgi:fructokinase
MAQTTQGQNLVSFFGRFSVYLNFSVLSLIIKFDCLGIASFGPIELHEGHPKYGFITTTPKPGWNDADVLGSVRRGLGLPADFPVAFDTDVNAPAMAEYAQAKAAGSNLSSCAYVTVGTGVGAFL